MGKPYAIKNMQKDAAGASCTEAEAKNETDPYKSLQHKNVVQLIEYIREGSVSFLVFDRMDMTFWSEIYNDSKTSSNQRIPRVASIIYYNINEN